MKKYIFLIVVFWPLCLLGQNDKGGSKLFGVVDGTINVSMFGGATYYVPLDIPKGVSGMNPDVGIVYNSQNGNGLLGYGWNIHGISTIIRTGSTLYHNGMMSAANFSDDDCFMLDGQRLIPVGNNGMYYEFKTENDEFAKIVFQKENGYFSKCEVRLENGNIMKYGYTDDSKLMAVDGNNVIKWMVSSISDRTGNTISYVYETYGNDSDIYIKQIDYTSNTQADLSAKYEISFKYSNNRFDNYHYYIAGNKITCNRILTSIGVFYKGASLSMYELSYDGNTNRMYNLLTRITYARGIEELDPIIIQWNTDDDDINNNTLYSQEIEASIFDDFTFVGDFNGDGYSDLLTVPYKPIYGYSTSVTAKIYLNNQNGEFNSIPTNMITLSQDLEWIHVLDINGDGYDDIVAQTLTSESNGIDVTYTSGFTVFRALNGNGFNNEFSTSLNSRCFVKTGDFLGEGRMGLMLIGLSGPDDNDYGYLIDGYPSYIHYDNGYSMCTFSDYIIDIGSIVADDFDGDGKTEIIIFNSSSGVLLSFYIQNGAYRIDSIEYSFANSPRASYFTGDFNNDGKADVLFNDANNGKYIALSTGTGFTAWITLNNTAFGNMVLPQILTYKHSLNNVSNSSYGVNMSDVDGDGKTDIIYFNGTNHPVFLRNFQVINGTTNAGIFKIEFQAANNDIIFKNQYFTMGNFLGEDHMSFIAVDPKSPASTTDDEVKIFSLPSTNARYSVSSITDMLGRNTEIEYDYLMPGNTDFYSYTNRAYTFNVKPCPMPILAMKSYTEHTGTNDYKTSFKYSNALMHRTGRGFVNFETTERTTYINNVAVKLENCKFDITTMGANAMALPMRDSTFVFSGGNRVLSEINTYLFQNVACSRQQSSSGFRHIVRPALLLQKTKHYNPDVNGQILSVEIVVYTYNYQNTYTYSDSYGCTEIANGINGYDCSTVVSCNYRNSTQITFKNDNYTDWIINRKSEEVSVTEYSSKPSITRKTKYEYNSSSPYLISQKTVIPSQNELNPLMVRYNYQYDDCGNVITETVSAPNGTQNEASVVTTYDYYEYRMLTGRTKDPSGLAYEESYSYDNYDRITKYIGSNGLMTTYSYYDPFNNYITKTAPDNTITSETMSWASNNSLTPTGAVYYKYVISSDGSAVRTFYDANGNTLRTVTLNHNYDPVIVDIKYNDRQLPVQKSYPYNYGDTPLWIYFDYDDFGRMISTTYPSGKELQVVYDGLTTTTTTSDTGNLTRTTEQTKNYLGWVTANIDANNTMVLYDYYPNGKIASMTTSGGDVVVEMEYDDAGNRVSLTDPDYGETIYRYDAFGRLIGQITPKGDRILYSYDVLGRVTQKNVPGDETTTSYQYNENTHKGTVASIVHTGQTLNYTYDQYDRLVTTNDIRIDTSYTISYFYGANSKLISKYYPSGYKVNYEYYQNGALYKIKNAKGYTLWQADNINACGQLLQVTTGNGVVTRNTYDETTNWLTAAKTTDGIQNFVYSFDKFGNMTSRTDSIGGVKTEFFTYDNLDRLTSTTINNVSSAMVYDSYGRMTSKQKDGSMVFSHASFESDRPHAIMSASTAINVFPNNQTICYIALDKVSTLIQDSKVATFTYGYDTQRIRMTVVDTLVNRPRTKDYVENCEFINNNGVKKVYTYLTGPDGVFAVVVGSSGGEVINYIYKDHLGSWTAITDSVGNVIERRSYDAWGNMSVSASKDLPPRMPKFDHGFTGHEHLFDFGLINMNGRMYDPLLSSFLSPDNYMQDPTGQQGFNRYAYCMYNPLKYIDPSGNQYYGWNGDQMYYIEHSMRQRIFHEWFSVYDIAMASIQLTINMACGLFSHGSDTHGNGSGNHGGGVGGSQNGSSGNGYVNDDPTNTTNSNDKPGSSSGNPTTAQYLFNKCYLHFQIGGGNPLYVDAQSLGLGKYSIYEDFIYDEKTDTYTINLLSNPYMFDNPQLAMALGQIVLKVVGDNMYEIQLDTYDFNFQPDPDRWDNGFFNWRNTATLYGGLINGTIYNTTYNMTPMFFGGSFDIIFVNNPIYIPYYP